VTPVNLSVLPQGWKTYDGASEGFPLRSLLRAMVAVVLLLGSLGGDWAPATTAARHACCCGMPSGVEDSCPCPKPEGNRTPRGACSERQAPVVQAASRQAEQGQRRTEPRPEPAGWARAGAAEPERLALPAARGRDPDLGRHLAHLSSFRI